MKMQVKHLTLSLKATGEEGMFEGYGSVFGNVDSYGDVVMPGAFARTIEERGAGNVAMLWQHSGGEPIGVWTEMREDARGLFMRGSLNMETQRGREAYALMKQGAIKGLSIGFMVRGEEYDNEAAVTRLTDIDLWEVSVVTFPANSAALVSAVKSLSDGETPDKRTLENALRDLGMNKRQAQALLADGYAGLTGERDVSRDLLIEMKLSQFILKSKETPNV